MDRGEAKKRIDVLKKQIDRHDRLYYIEDAPQISDEAYDLSLIHI